MAESNNNSPSDRIEEEERLRYLQFVQEAALQAVVCAAAVYAYAKESAGPLRPGVESVEGTVKTVVAPVYDRFHLVPLLFLRFLDRKVGESVLELERHVPAVVKEAPNVARSVAGEVQRSGLVGTAAGLARAALAKAEPAARGLYSRYEPVAERHAVTAWRSLHRLPLFPQVAQVVVPTAAQLSQQYNRVVASSAEHGSTVAAYLPLIPTEHIARVFAAEPAAAAAAPEMEPLVAAQ